MPATIEPAWAWIVAGLLLAGCELLAPGAFLIWIGLGAVATGLLIGTVALPWEVQLLVFAVLAGIAVPVGRRLARAPASNLNRRGHSLVGQTFTLETPIVDGSGRLRLGDTSWRITGPDLPAGTRISVTGLDGSTLLVRSADTAVRAEPDPS